MSKCYLLHKDGGSIFRFMALGEKDSDFCFCFVVVVGSGGVCLFTLRKRNIVSGLPWRVGELECQEKARKRLVRGP